MSTEHRTIKVLLVDDETDFRRTARTVLERRGFFVTEAACGEEALVQFRQDRPDIVVLDLQMPGLSGIETLQEIRKIDASVPAVILTGHGCFVDALAGIRLEIVDFLQKPMDLDLLGTRIRALLEREIESTLRERTLGELMVSPDLYPKLYADQSVGAAIGALREAFFRPRKPDSMESQRIRSVLVFDRNEQFVGIIRFSDLLKLVLPPYLKHSPYMTFFTGMFLAQCKVIGKRALADLMAEKICVDLDAPLMEAVHLMVRHHLINLPVMKQGVLVGILREKDLILEITRNMVTPV